MGRVRILLARNAKEQLQRLKFCSHKHSPEENELVKDLRNCKVLLWGGSCFRVIKQ